MNITENISITGPSKTWTSSDAVISATSGRTIIFHPDEVAVFLEAHERMLDTGFGTIPYRISAIDVDGQKVVAVGSAHPDFYFGGEELRLCMALLDGHQMRYAFSTTLPISSPEFEISLRAKIEKFKIPTPAPKLKRTRRNTKDYK